MGFKKHNWISFRRTGDIIEVTLRDPTGGRIDSFRSDNKTTFAEKIAPILAGKYGWVFTQVGDKERTKENDKAEFEEEKKWLDKEGEW